MYVRMNMLAGDPAQLDEGVRYLDGTVRPHVEAQPGNRGLAFLTNADLGLCVIASYWDSTDAMTASEQAVQVSRRAMTERMRGSVTVEQHELPVFVRRSRPQAGAGVRMVRTEGSPTSLEAAIDVFRNTAIRELMDMPGICSAQMLTDRATGRGIVITAWADAAAMAAARPAAARLRADVIAVTHAQIRS